MTDTVDTFLSPREVTRLTNIPTSTRYELIARGQFPKPIRLPGRRVAWSAREIEDWQKQRIAERDGEAD